MKKIPERMCVACRIKKPKKELLRVVANKEGEIFVDKTGKANGRGTYVCRKNECIVLAIKNKAFERALKTRIPANIYDSIKEHIEELA